MVLADVRMPKMDGLALLRQAKEQGSDASFVMMTAFASVEAAVEAMRLGAESYMVKPLNVKAVLVFLEKALEKRRLVRENTQLRAEAYNVINHGIFSNPAGNIGTPTSVGKITSTSLDNRSIQLAVKVQF